jgi:hypothetical protein
MFNSVSGTTPEDAQRATLPIRPVDGDGATFPTRPVPPDAANTQWTTLPARPAPAEAANPQRATQAAKPAAAVATDGARPTQPKRPMPAKTIEADDLLRLSSTARDTQEALEYAQRAVELSPDDAGAHGALQRAMLARLNQDAFVAFLAETANTYVVHLRQPRPLVVPKTRAQPEKFPPDKRTPGEHLWVLVWWQILGLVPAGVGALLLSPLVFQRSLAALNKPELTPHDRKLAMSALGATIALGLLGAAFTLLLILHTIG